MGSHLIVFSVLAWDGKGNPPHLLPGEEKTTLQYVWLACPILPARICEVRHWFSIRGDVPRAHLVISVYILIIEILSVLLALVGYTGILLYIYSAQYILQEQRLSQPQMSIMLSEISWLAGFMRTHTGKRGWNIASYQWIQCLQCLFGNCSSPQAPYKNRVVKRRFCGRQNFSGPSAFLRHVYVCWFSGWYFNFQTSLTSSWMHGREKPQETPHWVYLSLRSPVICLLLSTFQNLMVSGLWHCSH